MARSSIKSRLNQLALVPVGLALAVTFVAVIAWSRFQLHEASLDRLYITAQMLSFGLKGPVVFNYRDESQRLLDGLEAHPEIRSVHIFVEGKTFAQYPKDGATAEPVAAGIRRLDSEEAVVSVPVAGGVLRVTQGLEGVSRSLSSTLYVLLICLGICSLLGYFLAARLRRAIEVPITALVKAAQVVTVVGDYAARVETEATGEIQTLVEAFNSMLDGICRRDQRLGTVNLELHDKNQELEDIIYVTSHDLRSPLINVHGFGDELQASAQTLSTLLEGVELSGVLQEELDIILGEDIPGAIKFITQSARRMDDLLTGLLRMSRLGRAAILIQKIDMEALVDSVLATVQFQIKTSAATVSRGALPACEADMQMLKQLFSNLVDNALKYQDPDRVLNLKVSGRIEGGMSVYSVTDTGIGIDPQYSAKVFQMFHRLKDKESEMGEGLGLAVVRRIVERHGGRATVTGAIGVGSTFEIFLPTHHRREPS